MNLLSSSHVATAFTAGLLLSLSLIMAIGPQNTHILRTGLLRRHLWLTVAVCALADVFMIGAGVLVLGQLEAMSGSLIQWLVVLGAAFLIFYGWTAFQRWRHHAAHEESRAASRSANMAGGARKAVAMALAFSLLNPHAWVDTAVLIGSAAAAQGDQSLVFGAGAAAGSAIWFLGLGTAAAVLGQRVTHPAFWRWLDLAVAAMMWGIALKLLVSLTS
ncbi:LysE family transporter [Hydrogenophaga sp. 5NK40-0174]|uniref:LysE/ArgO family amino acid transporter n=1 Tax=Hydrogenophaga sp. 5NK40-0174 TaxID=3127649 RepID=UPI003106C838